MSEQLIPLPVITPETVAALGVFLQKRRDAAVADLQEIKTIDNDGQYAEAEETLSNAKRLYDQMVAKRKAFTDPIKEALSQIMAYENEINYTAKTDNEYNRARRVLEDYNQKKIEAKKVAEHEAWVRSEQIKYKAEFRAQVQQQLADMLAGKNRTVLYGMAEWEKALTLENIDANEAKIRNQNPTLKQADYDGCFRRWGNRPDVMAQATEDEYLEELKKELTYAVYNERFQQIVAPIKNEYLAKIPAIKESLKKIAEAKEADKAALKKAAEVKREQEKNEALRLAAEKEKAETQAIQDTKDMGIMEGDFTAQAMTADIDAGPSKKVFYFANDKVWLKPFLQVVAKCAGHPEFKGIMAKDGYVTEVKKWMDFYSSKVGEPMDGLKSDDVAKTIVRKK